METPGHSPLSVMPELWPYMHRINAEYDAKAAPQRHREHLEQVAKNAKIREWNVKMYKRVGWYVLFSVPCVLGVFLYTRHFPSTGFVALASIVAGWVLFHDQFNNPPSP